MLPFNLSFGSHCFNIKSVTDVYTLSLEKTKWPNHGKLTTSKLFRPRRPGLTVTEIDMQSR